MYENIVNAKVSSEIKDTYFGIRYSACILVGRLNKQQEMEGEVDKSDVAILDIYNLILTDFKYQILKK